LFNREIEQWISNDQMTRRPNDQIRYFSMVAVTSTVKGKLRLPDNPLKYVPSRLEQFGVLPLPIDQAHALHAATLPAHHRDPFDRLLIAQAQLEHLPILTSDPVSRPTMSGRLPRPDGGRP
jgi:PIN domain nuclease of toxin-antitoxin system